MRRFLRHWAQLLRQLLVALIQQHRLHLLHLYPVVIITWVHYYLAELLKVSQKPPLKLLVPYSESSIKMDIVLDQ